MRDLFSRRRFIGLATTFAVLPLAACEQAYVPNLSLTSDVQNRGYILDEEALATVKTGADVQSVLTAMGSPSTVSTIGNKTFYYISQTTRQRFRFTEPQVTDQRVVAIYFNKGFKVERVANYGLQDGVVFDFISRTTPTAGAEQSFVGNLFRGLSGSSFNPFGA
jgi:outer membrane protein assembly factor BamE (lipoprotein component of BamABCDE complex)